MLIGICIGILIGVVFSLLYLAFSRDIVVLKKDEMIVHKADWEMMEKVLDRLTRRMREEGFGDELLEEV